MTRNYSVVLALSALILTCGCKKTINSDSVDLATKAKADFGYDPYWQTPGLYGRVIHYNIDDGGGNDCLLAWDISSGIVSLAQINGTTASVIYSNGYGFALSNNGAIPIAMDKSDCTDPYNEVGGMHIIPYDATGSGNEDHLLVYLPGRGYAWVIHWANGQWVQDWFSETGIGGYDLLSTSDKIISYDYGQGVKNYLIAYRPGSGIVWVMHNNSTPSNPSPSTWNWSADLQSSTGIGSFDMKDPHDQLVTIGGPSLGNMNLCAYTPFYGYVYLINHIAYEAFNDGSPGMYAQASHSGLPGFSFTDLADRVVTYYSSGGATNVPENEGTFFCYRPGYGIYASAVYEWNSASNYLTNTGIPTGFNYGMSHDPYGSGTYIGDHIVPFSPGGYGNGMTDDALLFYSNGGNNQSQIYYYGSSEGYTYTEVY